jgi:hypothetical protein
MREILKFKKLLNEFKSLKFEKEYVEDVLMEANGDFEKSYSDFIEENEIDTSEFAHLFQEELEVQDDGEIYEVNGEPEELSVFKKTHRKLVRLLHPDVIDPDNPRKEEFDEDFKKMSSAIQNEVWADFFDVADKYNIEIEEVEEANKLLTKDIENLGQKIETKKKTFSWFLNKCDGDPDCRDHVIRTYFKSKFGWSRDES